MNSTSSAAAAATSAQKTGKTQYMGARNNKVDGSMRINKRYYQNQYLD